MCWISREQMMQQSRSNAVMRAGSPTSAGDVSGEAKYSCVALGRAGRPWGPFNGRRWWWLLVTPSGWVFSTHSSMEHSVSSLTSRSLHPYEAEKRSYIFGGKRKHALNHSRAHEWFQSMDIASSPSALVLPGCHWSLPARASLFLWLL